MNNFEKNSPDDPSKRVFGKALVAGAVVAATGLGINKYKEEEELNELFNSFKGQEKNFEKAEEVAKLLIQEMDNTHINKVKLIGEHPNNRIEILRSFLTKHIDSHTGSKYPFKNSLIISGYYTKENLSAVIRNAALFAVAPEAEGITINKYTKEEGKLNNFYLSLNGQEENFGKVKEVAEMLCLEMLKERIVSVSIYGPKHENKHIEILKTFLVNHLHSKAGDKYPFKDGVFLAGFFTTEILAMILEKASLFSKKKN